MQPDQSDHAPHRLIEWTGERCVPWTEDYQVVYEHYHRYLLARRFVAGKRVLDLASGEGYGSALLAERAQHVLGLEIDPASVAHSHATYVDGRLDFVEGSMLDLSRFSDDSFDVVTCFEALEHVTEHEELISGVRRVLAKDGIFITSTPDRLIYTEHLHQHNPHHVRELSLDEFSKLLNGHFRHVQIWGQVVAVGSLIQAVDDQPLGGAETITLARHGESWVQETTYPPTYYIAAASDVTLPDLPAQSILVDVDITLVRSAQRALSERSSELDSRTAELRVVKDEQLRRLDHLMEPSDWDENSRAQLAKLENEVVEAQDERDRAQDDLAGCQQELSAVRRSRLHRAAFSGQRMVAKLTGIVRR